MPEAALSFVAAVNDPHLDSALVFQFSAISIRQLIGGLANGIFTRKHRIDPSRLVDVQAFVPRAILDIVSSRGCKDVFRYASLSRDLRLRFVSVRFWCLQVYERR
jgi:hypothetical protein